MFIYHFVYFICAESKDFDIDPVKEAAAVPKKATDKWDGEDEEEPIKVLNALKMQSLQVRKIQVTTFCIEFSTGQLGWRGRRSCLNSISYIYRS